MLDISARSPKDNVLDINLIMLYIKRTSGENGVRDRLPRSHPSSRAERYMVDIPTREIGKDTVGE